MHHRLLDLGFDHYETVVVIYSVQALLVTLAVVLRYQSDLLVTSVYLGVVGGLFALLSIAEWRGWRRRTIGISALARVVETFRQNETANGIPRRVINILSPAMVLAGAVLPDEVPRDFGVASAVLAVIALIEVVLRRSQGSPVLRLAMYVAAVFSSYLFAHFGPAPQTPIYLLSIALIIGLAVAVALFIRYTSEGRFGSTPTDYLIVFGVLVLLAFGGTNGTGRAMVQTVIYSVVLLYACEATLNQPTRNWKALLASTFIALIVLAVRGLTQFHVYPS